MHLTCKAELTSFSDALSTIYFIHICNNENLQLILEHFRMKKFVIHDYSNYLCSEYTIFGLIASLLYLNSIMINIYEFSSDNRSSTDKKVLELKKYTLLLIIH